MADQDKIIATLVQYFRKKGDVIVLESQMKNHPASTKTYIAAEPANYIKFKEGKLCTSLDSVQNIQSENPWEALNKFQKTVQDWMFGFLSYDMKNHIENLNSENRVLLKTPELYFFVPGFLAEISLQSGLKVLRGSIPQNVPDSIAEGDVSIRSKKRTPKEWYVQKISAVQKQIKEGAYYEVNLSHPLEFEFDGKGWDLYQRMKLTGEVPFASYMKLGDTEVCSSSPERFLCKKGDRVFSQPIKGTISRSHENDELTIKKLSESKKDQAENLMIVDLVRNDLSRVSKKGSVKVKDLFEIQSFKTVHQMVSTVEAIAKGNVSAVDIVQACFPMGSMTGAPKIAAMQAIEEFEDYKRGIYSGSIGYFTPEADFDFSVVIRTAIIQNNTLVYAVGGAITSDSVPEHEWEETLVKARPITDLMN